MTQPDLFQACETLDAPKNDRATQSAHILAHLQSGRTITALEALDLYGSLRCGGRIFDLKAQGHNITSKMVKTASGKHVAQYKLEP